jgi:glucuronate isomerase
MWYGDEKMSDRGIRINLDATIAASLSRCRLSALLNITYIGTCTVIETYEIDIFKTNMTQEMGGMSQDTDHGRVVGQQI